MVHWTLHMHTSLNSKREGSQGLNGLFNLDGWREGYRWGRGTEGLLPWVTRVNINMDPCSGNHDAGSFELSSAPGDSWGASVAETLIHAWAATTLDLFSVFCPNQSPRLSHYRLYKTRLYRCSTR
eukprot:353408-Chlamydomonas_euryale.AAC.13